MSQQIPFSARNRGQHRQIDGDFPASARNGLLHLLHDLVEKEFVDGWAAIAKELERIARVGPTEYNQSSVPAGHRAKTDAQELLDTLRWDRVLDFCERLSSRLAKEVGFFDDTGFHVTKPRSEVQAYIADELQRLFSEEALAFEFSDGLVRRRGRKHTVDVVSRAEVVLGDPRLAGARRHYEKAIRFFRSPSTPDYENAVKEAVCAVEAAGKALFPGAKAATLGDFAKWLVTTKDVIVPKALGQTFTGVYAFRSGGEGVGHGGASGGSATSEVAEYVLAVCASQVIYLVDLANTLEADIPF